MPALRDKLRAICHSLKMGSYGGIEESEMESIRKAIKGLPSPEQISKMGQEELKSLQSSTNKILDQIDSASSVRSVGSAIRHHIDKNLPPFRAPVLGSGINWYKMASEDYSRRLSPEWIVVRLKGDKFQLQYNETPILDFVLILDSNRSYNGDIEEVKLYGGNYIKQVPKNVRPPMVIEMFSRAKDLIDSNSQESVSAS